MLFRKSEQSSRRQKVVPKQRMLPYKLASYEQDHEGKKFKSSRVVYSFWSASKYVLILSLMLWWLPMFGQMIAGYVGGRRAGGPWKGVAASILPVVCLYVVLTGFETGYLPSHAFGVAVAPAAIGAGLTHSIPFISPYLEFSSDYIGSFVSMLEGSSPYGINVYVLTVAFAYIGGVLAEQSRRELEFSSGSSTSNTTILVHDPNGMYAGADEEMQGGPEPARPRGVFAAIGGLIRRPYAEEPQALTAAHGRRRHTRDPWAAAAEMRYGDDGESEDSDFMVPSVEPLRAPDDYGAYQYRPSRRAQKREQWKQQQKRRGRPNMSAKPRFRNDQYSERPQQAPKQYNNPNGGSWRRPKHQQQYYVSGDPKSIKQANRMIDNEWGRRKYETFARVSDERAPVEADVAVHHHKKDHGSNHNWDSI
jgi:hypothetical protein